MNEYVIARLGELMQSLGPLFYRKAIPGGLLTIWPTSDGWLPIAIPDRDHPKGELRSVPIDGSNSRFTYRFHFPDDDGSAVASSWSHLIADARNG